MLAMLRVNGLFFLAVLILSLSTAARGEECKIPNFPIVPDPYADRAPKAPDQITSMKKEHFLNSENDDASYCLYSPPPDGPVFGLILYLHGAQLLEVGAYDPMLQNLAKSGYYVVYPYVSIFNELARYPTLARAALRDALAKLKLQKNVDISRIAVAGHSHGGAAAVRVAATWTQQPSIRALILHDPSGNDRDKCFSSDNLLTCPREWDLSAEALQAISCSTHVLIIQAVRSIVEDDPLKHWRNLKHIARYVGASGTTPQRNFLRVPHDVSHANIGNDGMGITLESTHLAPTVIPPWACRATSPGNHDYGCYLTSMDEYGYWRPTRAAVYEAFAGKPFSPDYSPYCSSVSTTGACSKTRDMGTWLDGVTATPMKNAAEIAELATNHPNYCQH